MGGFGTSSFHLGRKLHISSTGLRDKVRPGDSDGDLPDGVVILGAAALIVTIAGIVYITLKAVPRAFSILDANVKNQSAAETICGCAALAIGWFLYQLRRRQRGMYAFLEIGFAFASAALAMSKLHPQGDAAVWLAFAAAAYLVVRGLDNIGVARVEKAWPWSATVAAHPDADGVAHNAS
jgi:hypothetical protein